MDFKALRRIAVGVSMALVFGASPGRAQQLIIKGEFGNKAGVMPPPGLYAGMFGGITWSDELVGPDKNVIEGPELNQYIFGPLVQYVSKFCLFGANYGALVAVPFSNVAINFPRLDVDDSTGIALSQLWVVPVMLGWHLPGPLPLAPGGADLTFHYAFYAPTGRYNVILTNTGLSPAPDNTALGMWTNELSFRITSYFSRDRKWHGTASLFYDINSKKEDLDWKTGNPFTYMWGLGRDYGEPGSMFSGWVGAAGYSQWQVTSTTGIDAPLIARNNKTQVNGVGPEFTTLQGALTVRYFWQFGGKFTTRGQGALRPVRDAVAVLNGRQGSIMRRLLASLASMFLAASFLKAFQHGKKAFEG